MENCSTFEKVSMFYAVTVDSIMDRVKNFTVFDFAIMKICLSFTGMIIGVIFSKNLKKCLPFLTIVAIASYGYMLFKMFIEKEKN